MGGHLNVDGCLTSREAGKLWGQPNRRLHVNRVEAITEEWLTEPWESPEDREKDLVGVDGITLESNDPEWYWVWDFTTALPAQLNLASRQLWLAEING